MARVRRAGRGASGSYFLARLDASGVPVFARSFNAGPGGWAVAASGDATGNVLLAGTFFGTSDFGGGPFMASVPGDVFVARYDPAGNHLWSHDYGSGSVENALAVATSPAGDAWVTGDFQNLTDLGSGSLKSAGGHDVFLARYSANGAGLSSQRYGDNVDQYSVFLRVSASGAPVFAGILQGSIDVGSGPVNAGGGKGVYACRIAP